MADEVKAIEIPGEWALKKVLGPTLGSIGEDLNKVYQVGRDKIVAVAKKKIANIEDDAIANLRVSRDVFWNGAFTDEAICAEYFGGILAASRSEDGKDDTGVYYVDLIKSLSAKQLQLHYTIYRVLNKELVSIPEKASLNVGLDRELHQVRIHFSAIELEKLGLKPDIDLEALYRKGLLHEYRYEGHTLEDGSVFPYTMIVPTTLGVQLFAIANNQLQAWRTFSKNDFGDFDDISLPRLSALSLEDLIQRGGLK
jgi:hypothetical protein